MHKISLDWLKNIPIAHRGLWNENIVENSMKAYENAMNNGYPIEIDIYSSLDGVLYSFHDNTLDRMTEKTGNIFEKTSSELNTITLKGTQESIPTLEEVLAKIDGKIPILIEIKNQPDKKIVERVLEALKGYKGEYAIQSFNPLYIRKVKKLAPSVVRGLLYTSDKNELKSQRPLTRLILRKMLLNFIIKPHFLSCQIEEFPIKKRKSKGKILLAWTIRNEEEFKKIKPYADNIIFEGFIPNF